MPSVPTNRKGFGHTRDQNLVNGGSSGTGGTV